MIIDQNLLRARRFSHTNISTSTETLVKEGNGVFHSFTINKNSVGGAAVVYDSLEGSGTKIATIDTQSVIETPLVYDVEFNTGLTIVTTGLAAADLTISYA